MKTFLEWYNSRNVFNSSGFVQRIIEGYKCDIYNKTGSNVTTIEIAKHYSGSGPTSFGGAKEWPNITVDIGIPVETSQKDVESLLHDIRMLLNKHGYK